jgi:membrane protease YdiL (CAAX protease family)
MNEERRSAVRPARHLAYFAIGALVSLAASVFAVGVAFGLSGVSGPTGGMAATSAVLCVALLLLSRWLLRREGATLTDLGLMLDRERLRQFGLGLAIGAVLFLGVAGAQSAAVGARWDFLGGVGFRAASIGLATTFVLVLAEELLFRGVALRSLRALYGDRRAVVLTALLFGGYHLLQSENWAMGAVFTFLTATLGGLVFGWAAVRSAGLALPLGLHLGGNWVQASLTGFGPAVESGAEPTVHALWRISLSSADVRALTAPDLLPHLPYIVALALAAVLVGRFIDDPHSRPRAT